MRKDILLGVLVFLWVRTAHPENLAHSSLPARNLTILVESLPDTLIPRNALDATSQRLGALLYRGLTRLNKDLEVIPGLASSWKASNSAKTWTFQIPAGLKDQAGGAITPTLIAECLEQYRVGKPTSALGKSFKDWKSTEVRGDSVILNSEKSDPYLDRNISLLRYFRVAGSTVPCQEPRRGDRIIGSGNFAPQGTDYFSFSNQNFLRLVPTDSKRNAPVDFVFVRDDAARAMKLIKGEVDLIQNGLSLAKSRWLQKSYSDRFEVIERDGSTISYLSFNLKDPILSKVEVRRAMALAIDRRDIVDHKLFGFGTIAQTLVSPLLPEAAKLEFPHDLKKSEELLDQAGFPRGKNGVRFSLRYKSTPIREGLETALMLQNIFKRIGIEVRLEVVEPAVFLQSVRKGNYQIFSSRWIGVSDASILNRTLHSGQNNNRAQYQDAEMDRLLDAASAEPSLKARLPGLQKIQQKMLDDLPYFPLWFWNNAVVIRKEVQAKAQLRSEDLSLTGALDTLVERLTLLERR
ncbi:ABC transporter substrate-binding protein [bacterium]|nr:ABC transporter substrate-binding protein [bacterium]